MGRDSFRTVDGRVATAVTADEMREVDRVAVEEVGLAVLQMMEHAGRAFAWHVRDARGSRRADGADDEVVVLAGDGGNGGGGLVCARRLANRGVPVRVVLDRPTADLTGVAEHQHRILDAMGVPVAAGVDALPAADDAVVVADALVGYGLSGALRSPAREYVERANASPGPVVSLDVPSGLDATTGEAAGPAVVPDRTVTLALPKTGLDAVGGRLFLADLTIPATVYDRLGIDYRYPFGDDDWVELVR
ncbi:NAD(P)H-hydrate epimerase [Halobaculum sp. EA56]|uniref:NAD(P)H-hydrate epimerase n=1 Tax=Halobaculum sp. EA56 TaxID=3421648 RepID=UPI003EBBFCF6